MLQGDGAQILSAPWCTRIDPPLTEPYHSQTARGIPDH